MRFFDLHCDTIGECKRQDKALFENDLQLSLSKGSYLDRWIQVFAIWMPDEFRGAEAEEYFNGVFERFQREIFENRGYIRHCTTLNDLDSAAANKECAAILSVEGASAFAGSLEKAERAFDAGVKLVTLTWNGANEAGSGVRAQGGGGLTPFGKDLCRLMERRKIAVDVSHLNREGFYDVAETLGVPFVASHSDSADVLRRTRKPSLDAEISAKRNLDDAQIKLLAERGGLIGINFCNSFLGDSGDDGCEAVYRHVSHMLSLGCEKTLCMGSDFDGCDINDDFSGIEKLPVLCDYLLSRGLSEATLEDIFFENASRFFVKHIFS